MNFYLMEYPCFFRGRVGPSYRVELDIMVSLELSQAERCRAGLRGFARDRRL